MENYKRETLYSAMYELVKSKVDKDSFDSTDDYLDFILALSDLAVDFGASCTRKVDY